METETCHDEVVVLVSVDRSFTPWDALAQVAFDPYIDLSIVEGMADGVAEKVELVFFRPPHDFATDEELEKEFSRRGLRPANPITLTLANAKDSNLARMPHGTHFKGPDGKWCDITFDCFTGVRRVRIHSGGNWESGWWIVGARP